MSLVAADNNAAISPTEGDARIIILGDIGSAGTVGIAGPSSVLYMGEPAQGYSGSAEVRITSYCIWM